MQENKINKLSILFQKWANEEVIEISLMPQSGSYREYYRICGKTKKVLGVYNADKKENHAFIEFTKQFKSENLSVPKIYAELLDDCIYLIEDLGDETLFSYLTFTRKNQAFTNELVSVYKKIVDELPKFQILAGQKIDFSACYPRASFDKQSMMWDLNYFKYYFLKLAKIPFDEQLLEDDFQTFSDYLLKTKCDYFLYRDFQSRNIMLVEGKPYFIDYQGGRKGALQYDLASLLYDAKADIPQNVRDLLLEYYIDVLSKYISVDRQQFREYYYGYVLIRIMQAMGAYGFRGLYEKKEHFLRSIPYAINNLKYLLQTLQLPLNLPSLMNVLKQITQSEDLKKFENKYQEEKQKLTITITSFSYKKGIPEDTSGNGGGFVFDCRAIHNPGRFDEYKSLTGKDKDVILFLENVPEMNEFIKHVFALADMSIEIYIKRKFNHLMVNFGCTGGQHRSVFSAEKFAAHVKEKYDVNVILFHRELKNEK